MPSGLTPYTLRLQGRISLLIWLAWSVAAVALSVPALIWHLEYAQRGHPTVFWVFAGALVLAAFALPVAYQAVRRGALWQQEPLMAAGVALTAIVVYEPLAATVVAWCFVTAWVIGDAVCDWLDFRPASLPVRLVLAVAIGFGILVWPLVLLGHLQLYRPWVFLVLLTLPASILVRRIQKLWHSLVELHRQWGSTRTLAELPAAAAFVMTGILLVSGLAVALAPSIAFDPLRFHLPLARYYATTGGLHPLASDGYGYNPQNFEMLLAMVWDLAGQAAAQLVTPFFFLLFLVALFAVARAAGAGRAGAVVATVCAAAVPYVHWTGVNVKHDLVVAFLHLASLLAWLEWRKTGRFRWIYLGVFLAATSFGFKHPAAFGIIGLSVLFIHAAWKQPNRVRAFVGCGLLFLALGSLWQVRSYVMTGDAFFYYNLGQPLPPDHAAQVGSVANRLVTGTTWPWQIHFDGGLFFRSATGNPVGVLLLIFAPLWLLLRRRKPSPGARACLVFAWASLIPWAFYVPLLRFVIAPLSLLVVLTVARLHEWHLESTGGLRLSLRLATGYSLLFSLCVILILEVNGPQFRYFAGQLDKREYLEEALLTYRSLEALGKYAGPQDKVLGSHNCSMAYAPYPERFYCGYHDPNDPAQVAEIQRAVDDRGFRYLILPSAPVWGKILAAVTERRPAETLYTGQHYSLYRLTEPRP